MIILLSLLSSAFFSGMEIAYVSSNRLNLEIEKKQKGLIPKLLSIITKDPSRFISTMLIGNSFALVIYGLFMGQFIVDNLSFLFLQSMNELTVLLLQTIISTLLILIAAEFIPKSLSFSQSSTKSLMTAFTYGQWLQINIISVPFSPLISLSDKTVFSTDFNLKSIA